MEHVKNLDHKSSPKRLRWVLTFVPLMALLVTAVVYLVSWPSMPKSIAIHVGPDGFGFGSLQTTATAGFAVAGVSLVFGTRYTLNRLKIGFWYMAEKTTAAAFISIGYAVLAALLTLVFGMWGINNESAQESAFTTSILIFALALIASMGIHAVVLPRTRNFETP